MFSLFPDQRVEREARVTAKEMPSCYTRVALQKLQQRLVHNPAPQTGHPQVISFHYMGPEGTERPLTQQPISPEHQHS